MADHERKLKKPCRYGAYGLFEHLLFLSHIGAVCVKCMHMCE